MCNFTKQCVNDLIGTVGVSSSVSQNGLGMTQHKPLRIFYNRVPKCGSSTFRKLAEDMAGFNKFTYALSTNFLQYNIDENNQVWYRRASR